MEKEIVTIYKEPKLEYTAKRDTTYQVYGKKVAQIKQFELEVYVYGETGEKYVNSAAAEYLGITGASYYYSGNQKYYQISDKLLKEIEKDERIIIKYVYLDKNHNKEYAPVEDKIHDNYRKDDLKDNYYINIETSIKLGIKNLKEEDINNGLYGPLTEEELSILNSKYVINIEAYDESKNRNK